MKYEIDLGDQIQILPVEPHRLQALCSPVWNGLPEQVKRERLALLTEAQKACQPASFDEIILALTPCLSLVAPTGFTQADREEWLTAAAMTLSEMSVPADILHHAASEARRSPESDHPAKVIPAMVRAIGDQVERRHRQARYAESNLSTPLRTQALAIEADDIPPLSPEELRTVPSQILKLGLKLGFITKDDFDTAFGGE